MTQPENLSEQMHCFGQKAGHSQGSPMAASYANRSQRTPTVTPDANRSQGSPTEVRTPHGQTAPVGVLLMNTGTPDEPTIEAITRYLAEFMSDPVLFTAPPFIWKQVVKRFILPKRPKTTIESYRKLWTDQGFPFMNTSLKQGQLLEKELRERDIAAHVQVSMRYGNPSIASGLAKLREAGCRTLVLTPLYPQKVRACTGTCIMAAQQALQQLRTPDWSPSVIEVASFHTQPDYIRGLADSIRCAWKPRSEGRLLLSFHSTVMSHVKAGDPYPRHCEETRLSLAHELGINPDKVAVSYHSRFDNRKWLQPFSSQTIREWASQGITDICVACPGFTTDCMETLLDIGQELKEEYLAQAPEGSRFTYAPCLNDSPALIDALACQILEELR